MFEAHGLTITSYCAHSLLLDPPAPWRYGTPQIIKAVRAAAAMGVPHVITTEGEAHTDYGRSLTESEALFTIRQRLYEPLRMAEDFGVKILLEPHGPYTDSVERVEKLIDLCNSDALGINLDTGNLWLGGGDPVEFVKRLGSKIEHVHWKDMPADLESQRGSIFGMGMATIPLGSGSVDIAGTVKALQNAGFDGYTTLEVAGDDALKGSVKYLESIGAV
jgi:inosose dehydratase